MRGRATVTAVVTFRILFAIDAIAAAIALYFFVWGLQDGSVSSFNILHWAALLAVPAATLGGAVALRSRGQVRAANLVLLMLAVPALLLGLLVLLLAVASVHWN